MNYEMTPEKTKLALEVMADSVLVTDLVTKWVQRELLSFDALTSTIEGL